MQEISCTELEQTWGASKSTKPIDVMPISSFCHVSPPVSTIQFSERDLQEFYMESLLASDEGRNIGKSEISDSEIITQYQQNSQHTVSFAKVTAKKQQKNMNECSNLVISESADKETKKNTKVISDLNKQEIVEAEKNFTEGWVTVNGN
ncbi:hypothetical protein FQR65_LT15451 [Abscondita terminalis]|nr:hypothetical protein FQR65_LT15451 [Abscondita terminalis]